MILLDAVITVLALADANRLRPTSGNPAIAGKYGFLVDRFSRATNSTFNVPMIRPSYFQDDIETKV